MWHKRSSYPLTTGNQLKAARALAGITQKQLAQASGFHVNTVKYIERQDRISVTGSTIERIADTLEYFGVGVDCEPVPHVWLIDQTAQHPHVYEGRPFAA